MINHRLGFRISAFSTSATFRCDSKEKSALKLIGETGEFVVVNPLDQPKRLPYLEERRVIEDEIDHDHTVRNAFYFIVLKSILMCELMVIYFICRKT